MEDKVTKIIEDINKLNIDQLETLYWYLGELLDKEKEHKCTSQ